MTAILKYDLACRALAEAVSMDEVKDIIDKAEAMRIYARQAKNTENEERAAIIRLRGKRRLGEMLIEHRELGRLHEGRPRKRNDGKNEPLERIKIADFGIDKKFSVDLQELARLSDESYNHVEAKVAASIRESSLKGYKSAVGTEEKKIRRNQKEKLLGEHQQALPNKKFGVVVADPEWRFEPWSRETGMDRAADNHYPTSCTEVIADRDVPSISAKDCVLFLWATIPMLPHALVVMAAWGFDYKSHYVWGKDKQGTGYWNFEKHELLLIGTRGKIPCPAPGTQKESLRMSRRLKHSQKPEMFLEMIESWYPTLPKIELNRRGPARKGWAAWGNESSPLVRDKQTKIAELVR